MPAAARGDAGRGGRAVVGDTEALRLAAEGSLFTRYILPAEDAEEFVVREQEVEDVLVDAWEPVMQARRVGRCLCF